MFCVVTLQSQFSETWKVSNVSGDWCRWGVPSLTPRTALNAKQKNKNEYNSH